MDPITTTELIAFLSEFFLVKEFVSDAQSSGKSKLKSMLQKHKELETVKQKLNEVLGRSFLDFERSSLDEEFDFQGLCEYFGSSFLDSLKLYLTESGSARESIKSDIILKAQKYAKGKGEISNSKVEAITLQIIETIYAFYREQSPQSEKLLAGEIEETVITAAEEIKNGIEDLKAITNATNIRFEQKANEDERSKKEYSIRPDFKNSDRKSHKLIQEALDSQLDGNVERVIKLLREAISAETLETTPDERTLAYSRYLLVHYLLSNSKNIPEALRIIETVIAFEETKKDEELYSNIIIQKAKALVLSGKVSQARNALRTATLTDTAPFMEVNSLVFLYEGDTEQAVKALNDGVDNALTEYAGANTEIEKRASYQHYFSFLTQLGTLYICIQRPDLSLSLWKKAIIVANDMGYIGEKARCILPYVECLIQYEKWDDALSMLDEAYRIKENDNDEDFFWKYYNLKAQVFMRRNNTEQEDYKRSIDTLKTLLERGLADTRAVAVLQTIAQIQAENGFSREAIANLNLAEQIAVARKMNRSGDIEIQRNDIIKGIHPFSDNQYKPTIKPPSTGQVSSMIEEYQMSEVSLERVRLAFDIGMGLIDVDPTASFTWLEKCKSIANKLWNQTITARSLLGQAWVLFSRKDENSENIAEQLINQAISKIENIPIWNIHARAMMLKGMSRAHNEDFKTAYNSFIDAQRIVELHKVNDQQLIEWIEEYLSECEIIISRSRFTDLDFDTIISEAKKMETWFPKYRKELLQFLWYNRYEDIERLISTAHGPKAFMITDNIDELNEWTEALETLFEIISFSSETDYHNENNWNFATTIPVPPNMKSNYFNLFTVLDIT